MGWIKKLRGGLLLPLMLTGAAVGACLVPSAASAATNGQQLVLNSRYCARYFTLEGFNQSNYYEVHTFGPYGCGWHIMYDNTPFWWYGTVWVIETFPSGVQYAQAISVPRNDGTSGMYWSVNVH
jgi:hypothetical protein